MAMAEFAWTSFDQPSKIYRGLTDNGSRGIKRIHICQKPVALYSWIIKNYVKPGNHILDTHLGSASIAIAVYDANEKSGMNLRLTGTELDPDYYRDAMKRLDLYARQTKLRLI